MMSPVALAVLAYACWGLVPAYWKQLPSFHAEELILYRIILSSLSLLPVILWKREGKNVLSLLRSPRALAGCLTASLLIGFNWYLYILAILNGHVIESSLGYFLNPLVNMALGTMLLKERLNKRQWLACAFAAGGTGLLTWQSGHLPWISLLLALSFGLYGFTRKVMRFPTLAATFSETAVLSLPAVFCLWQLHTQSRLHVSGSPNIELCWLLLSGLVTTIPLLAFAEAAKHLPLSSMGFLQFISPTLQFLLGVFLFRENFGPERWFPFCLIWVGLGVFLFDLARRTRGIACSRPPLRK